jgi:KAP family P-loop domain
VRKQPRDGGAAAAGFDMHATGPGPPAGYTVFRNFSTEDFYPTDSWRTLRNILDGNGGCFGLYGPRGSGKSWLMQMAIAEIESEGGLGLWYPCPSDYDAFDFLSTLSDNLASSVERKFSGIKTTRSVLNGIRNITGVVAALLLVLGLTLYGVHGITSIGKTTHGTSALTVVFPAWVWITAAAAAFLFIAFGAASIILKVSAKLSLVREATSLRERIRFTESMKVGANLGLSAGKGITASLAGSRERALSERQASIASLVFDFRNLAARIVSVLNKSLVICIDELDKIDDAEKVRSLLRNIKGIFEIRKAYFLVSVSEEAAASLHIGILHSGGRNELNSSFYSTIALPPLDPAEADQLLQHRSLGHTARLGRALCLFAGGNRRELVRMADACATYSRRRHAPLDEYTIIDLLNEESLALLQEITHVLPEGIRAAPDEEDVKYRAWMALPRDAFLSSDKFVRLGISAIHNDWEPRWATEDWKDVREPWRRFLVRLFVAARVLQSAAETTSGCLLDDDLAVKSMRDILVMATRDSGVARLLLSTCFGSDLSERFHIRPSRGSR